MEKCFEKDWDKREEVYILLQHEWITKNTTQKYMTLGEAQPEMKNIANFRKASPF